MSKIEVNTVAPQCGTTLTLGESGDTVTLGAGASQSGFGRTGTVDWQTGSIKTSTFTAANGEGYFANTTGSAFTMNLPSSPSAGNIVSVKDYAQTFETNNLTVGRGGSNIEGVANDIILDANGESITLVYVDATKGWVLVGESLTQYGPEYIAATGGTITTCGNFKIHTFTGPGTFQVTNAGNSGGSDKVSYVVIAGGGGAGGDGGGGGGAGGFREGKDAPTDSYSASPLATTGLTTPATSYPITVGGGGAGGAQPAAGAAGVNSVFSTITSTGGGIGGGRGAAGDGGSGGGGQRGSPQTAGSGNTPPVSPAQGTNGGPGGPPNGDDGGGGGGGATVAGSSNGPSGGAGGGAGGAGATSSINGTPTARAGGGGGGSSPKCVSGAGVAGAGGGGTGVTSGSNATNGTANTGGGGGGSSGGPGIPVTQGGSGGSGIVIIRYKFQ